MKKLFRYSLPGFKQHELDDANCPRPFLVIGYDTEVMTRPQFIYRIRFLRVSIILTCHNVFNFQKRQLKVLPTNSMYPNKIIDIGSQYTKNLIFQHGYNALTFRERLNGNLWFKPALKFIIITGNERIKFIEY